MSTTATTSNQPPTNPLVTALLTDLYQITMTYAHWKIGKHNDDATFELFFRKPPFQGQFTVFAGLDECLKHISSFSFSESDIAYLKQSPALAHCEEGYFEYLQNLTTQALTVRALPEGTICFPRVPLLILKGPLGIGQLLETTLLNLVNFPSLLATNAARMVLRAGGAPCIEFGLRRAQGPDGALTASKYSFVGGFTATSNVQAGKLFDIPIAGTHAHAYVQAFVSLDEVKDLTLHHKGEQQNDDDDDKPFLETVLKYREQESSSSMNTATNDGELAAFVAYACAFPEACLCLVDTYDTLHSGIPNFCFVAMALHDFGYQAKGVRLDSGNLAELSSASKAIFQDFAARYPDKAAVFDAPTIIVSNDINEKVLVSLTESEHAITAYGIGTNLVTCQAQPALGCVYKLVLWNGKPRIKLSQDLPKMTIPGEKKVYRLYESYTGEAVRPVCDLMTGADESAPKSGEQVICRDPFRADQQTTITPALVVELHKNVYDQGVADQDTMAVSLKETKAYVQEQLQTIPTSITRYNDPEKYPVYVSPALYDYLHSLREQEMVKLQEK